MPRSRYIFGTLPWYSVLIILGMVLAIIIASREEKSRGLPRDTIIDLSLFMLPAGIIGARIYYVIFAWDEFRMNPVSALYIWNGGLAIYGGIIAGFITAVIFARKRKISLSALLDVIAPCLALAQAIGRWGNFFNMEAYGLTVENSAFQFFPLAVLIPENGVNVWHMATFFYESCWDLLTFCVLYFPRKRFHRSGDIFLGYVLLYGCGRLVIEGLRMDSLMTFSGNLRVSQWLSILAAAAVVFLMTARRIMKGSAERKKAALTAGMIGIMAAVIGEIIIRDELLLPLMLGFVALVLSVLPALWCRQKGAVASLAAIGIISAAGWILAGNMLGGWLVPFARCLMVSVLMLGTGVTDYVFERGEICPQQN